MFCAVLSDGQGSGPNWAAAVLRAKVTIPCRIGRVAGSLASRVAKSW